MKGVHSAHSAGHASAYRLNLSVISDLKVLEKVKSTVSTMMKVQIPSWKSD